MIVMMKVLTINGKEFRMKSEVAQFLDAYLQRIASFVKKHMIDADLYQDILQMVDEKISAYQDSEHLSQKNAIQIVNEL